MTARVTDLAGWDTRLAQMSVGLDLDQAPDRSFLAARLRGVADPATLTALAAWLGRPTRATRESTLAAHVADTWSIEVSRRAAALTPAAVASVFDRLPQPDDEPW